MSWRTPPDSSWLESLFFPVILFLLVLGWLFA
jgi:hypothetical protein